MKDPALKVPVDKSALSAGTQENTIFYFLCFAQNSAKLCGMGLGDRFLGYDLQSLHQHPILFRCDLHCFCRCTWPTETPNIQPFIKQQKTISFPDQSFQAVGASSAEQEQNVFLKWIQIELAPDDVCQTVDSFSQIGITGRNKDF